MRPFLIRGLFSACLALLMGCAATPATQLLVVVDSDVRAGCFGVVVSRVDALNAIEPGAPRRILNVDHVPFSFGVATPAGDANRRVQVSVELLADCMEPDAGALRVHRAVRTNFRQNYTLRLPLYVQSRCVMCSESSTCAEETTQCEAIGDVVLTERDAVTPGTELNPLDASAPDAGTSR